MGSVAMPLALHATRWGMAAHHLVEREDFSAFILQITGDRRNISLYVDVRPNHACHADCYPPLSAVQRILLIGRACSHRMETRELVRELAQE